MSAPRYTGVAIGLYWLMAPVIISLFALEVHMHELPLTPDKLRLVAASLNTAVFAAPETYDLDGTHSFPRSSFSHFGYSTQLRLGGKSTGKVVFDKAGETSSVDIVIDTKSVNAGYPIFNEHIRGNDFLDTAKFPSATFKSANVIEGDKPGKAEGNLTLRGVTKPVTLTVTAFQAMLHPMLKKVAVGANAFTVIKRSEFNAGKCAPYVGDEVRIDIVVEAIKEYIPQFSEKQS